MKTLSALNLDGNTLDYPPFDVIKQGIKAIQQYLRERLSTNDDRSSISSDEDPEEEITPRLSQRPIYPRKSKYFSSKVTALFECSIYRSETGYYETSQSHVLPPHFQSCIQYKRVNYSAIRPSSSLRSRPQSELRLTRRSFFQSCVENSTEFCGF